MTAPFAPPSFPAATNAMPVTGAASITHDDRGRTRIPRAAEDWDNWVSASAVRAWCLEDPLLDFLDEFGRARGFVPDNEMPDFDPRCDMETFVVAKGNEFGDRIVALLAERVASLFADRHADPLDRFAAYIAAASPTSAPGAEKVMVRISQGYEDTRDLKAASATFAAMRHGIPLIAQAVLRNPQDETYGAVDLLIRSDVLRELFPSEISAAEAVISAPELEVPVVPDLSTDPSADSGAVLGTDLSAEDGRPAAHHTTRPAPWHFVAVEIKFKTLDLLVDGAASSEMLPAAAQVFIYNRALGRLQGYRPRASYILGRSWREGSGPGGHGAFERLARVDDARVMGERGPLSDIVAAALEWRRRLARFGARWQVLPTPSVAELAPHMRNNEDAPWHGTKAHIAAATGELTLLPGMNPRRRAAAQSQGIMRWDDAAPGISGAVLEVAPYLVGQCDAVLAANRPPVDADGHQVAPSADNAVLPAHIGLFGWRIPAPLELFVDFESVSNLDDNFGALPAIGGTPMIFQIGCGWVEDGTRPVDYVAGQATGNGQPGAGASGKIAKAGSWGFRQFTVDALTEAEELRIIDEFVAFVAGELDRKHLTWDQARLIHYSAAEKSLMDSQYRGARTRHPEATWPAELPWWDLLARVIKAEPVTVRGAFNFGLKSMVKAMTSAGFINVEWKDGPADGLGATIGAFWAAKEAKRLGVSMTAIPLVSEIGKYNEVDTRALAELAVALRRGR